MYSLQFLDSHNWLIPDATFYPSDHILKVSNTMTLFGDNAASSQSSVSFEHHIQFLAVGGNSAVTMVILVDFGRRRSGWNWVAGQVRVYRLNSHAQV